MLTLWEKISVFRKYLETEFLIQNILSFTVSLQLKGKMLNSIFLVYLLSISIIN